MAKFTFWFLAVAICWHSQAIAQLPLGEIQEIIQTKSLESFPESFYHDINSENINVLLQQYDHFSKYILPPKHSVAQRLDPGITFFLHENRLWARPRLGRIDSVGELPEVGVVTAINQKTISYIAASEISIILKGALQKPNLLLAVSPDGTKETQICLVRSKPTPYSEISWLRKHNSIVVIRIDEFVSHSTAVRFAAVYESIVRAEDKVIIDLRGCGGGDFDESLEIAGMFVPPTDALVIAVDHDRKSKIYRSPAGTKYRSPEMLLVDRYSASAAEILAGILSSYLPSRLVGEQTYGKCISQTVFTLADQGQLWLSTLAINFPDGSTCTGTGLKPDQLLPDITTMSFDSIFHNLLEGKGQ